jgi:hypothetical protein
MKATLLRDALLLVVVAAGYVAWRAPGDLVWDDTPAVLNNIHSERMLTLEDWDTRHFRRTVLVDPFRQVYGDGYRPLNTTVSRLGMAYCGTSSRAPVGLLMVNGVLMGLLTVVYYRLARRFTRTAAGAALSVLLLLASTPLLTGSLVLFRGVQTLVPLTMCGSLLCYFAARESRRPWFWLLALAALLFLGPWYREFIGITALVILVLEVQSGRWRSLLALVAVLGFLHALFPTALPRLLFFPDLPVRPVFLLGVLGHQVRSGISPDATWLAQGWGLLESLRWRVVLDLLSILPPTLFLLAAAGWIVTAMRDRAAAVAPRQAVFLVIFFLLTFLPFLKVFKLHVHLAYCLVPGSILLAASVEALWVAARQRTGAALLVWALLLVAIGDHALNIFVVRRANLHCQAAVTRLAEFCDREMPGGSTLLTNAHHSYDIRLRCGRRFACYYTSLVGSDWASRVRSTTKLVAVMEGAGDAGLYCLDARLPQLAGQLGVNRAHWVMRDRPVEMLDYGEIDRVSYKYPVVDPLKLLLPTQNIAWPCSPDLEFDYYRGPALDGTPCTREIAVSYHFSKVLQLKVRGGAE